ncbi:hypothetical protein [Cerasicoccus maritimus]|uniref:hypothetical protein n=1 Tax=Cerasicoccus maritimus TaxID=490089 RepID=UPI002852BF5E|nr:hypothetical protein [Cerasicoccus maritimus]
MLKALACLALVSLGYILGQFYRVESLFIKSFEDSFKEQSLEAKLDTATKNLKTGYAIYALRKELWIYDGKVEHLIPNTDSAKMFLDSISPKDESFVYLLEATESGFPPSLTSTQIFRIDLPLKDFDDKEIQRTAIPMDSSIYLIFSLKACEADGSTLIAEVLFEQGSMNSKLVRIDTTTGAFELVE